MSSPDGSDGRFTSDVGAVAPFGLCPLQAHALGQSLLSPVGSGSNRIRDNEGGSSPTSLPSFSLASCGWALESFTGFRK